jgi:hypothetical protein
MADRVTNSIPVQETISEMVRQIAAQFHPDKIILFESHARGSEKVRGDIVLHMTIQWQRREGGMRLVVS